jgi:hypothetical protein
MCPAALNTAVLFFWRSIECALISAEWQWVVGCPGVIHQELHARVADWLEVSLSCLPASVWCDRLYAEACKSAAEEQKPGS